MSNARARSRDRDDSMTSRNATLQRLRTKCPELAGQNVRTVRIASGSHTRECASATDAAFGRDLSTLTLDQRLADGKAEPGALPALRGEEGIEYLLDHLVAHADAGVGHLDGDALMAVALGIEASGASSVPPSGMAWIALTIEIDQHLLQLGAVHQHRAGWRGRPDHRDLRLVRGDAAPAAGSRR